MTSRKPLAQKLKYILQDHKDLYDQLFIFDSTLDPYNIIILGKDKKDLKGYYPKVIRFMISTIFSDRLRYSRWRSQWLLTTTEKSKYITKTLTEKQMIDLLNIFFKNFYPEYYNDQDKLFRTLLVLKSL